MIFELMGARWPMIGQGQDEDCQRQLAEANGEKYADVSTYPKALQKRATVRSAAFCGTRVNPIGGIRVADRLLRSLEQETESPDHQRTALTRLWTGLALLSNWMQLARFAAVGSTGFALNLACFYIAVRLLGFDHLIGAVAAFTVAVTNNFMWNRHWTFGASGGNGRRQAIRFLAVSAGGFVVATALLDFLIRGVHAAPVAAQAISVTVAMPLTFLGNKLWTFDSSNERDCSYHSHAASD